MILKWDVYIEKAKIYQREMEIFCYSVQHVFSFGVWTLLFLLEPPPHPRPLETALVGLSNMILVLIWVSIKTDPG